jgi:phenylpropionate dioxygenase-like ring-hydroxylating dioxygenase large terminal subunit
MKSKPYKLDDVFRNTIKCHCGVRYDVEFYYRRFLESKTMNVECPNGHVQTVQLRPVFEDSGMCRLIDQIEFAKRSKVCGN